MSDPDPAPLPNAVRMPALLSYVRQRRCALFVGAGLSRPAGYPGWRGLMETTLGEAVRSAGPDAEATGQELTRLLNAGRYAEVADQCRQMLGRQRFWDLLRSQLSGPAEPPPATHEAIVRTPYACLVTTNFDTLLEDAFARWSDTGIPKAPTGMQLGDHGTLLVDGAFFILKAHGTIHDESSLVFTSEDYRRIIHENPAFQSMMAAILLSHALLFVGYSLSDPNFRLLIESQLSIFGTQAPPRYALMEGVGRAEAQILRRTAGIEVISYPPGRHEEVSQFLRAIADATATPDPKAPPAIRIPSRAPELPALTLSIRPRHAMLEAVWYETTVQDLAGTRVSPERKWMASIGTLPWTDLARLGAEDYQARPHATGRLLGQSLARLRIPVVADGRPRLVMLDLPPELSGLPWEWTEIDGRPLCVQAPVCRTVPSLNDSSRGRPFPHAPLRVLLIGDTLTDAYPPHSLPETREEVEAILDCFRRDSTAHQVTVITGSQACYQRVLDEITQGGHDIVHVAGVAYVDDTGESVLPLHDGHVRASELATLLIRRPPVLVFLNADESGFVPVFGGSRPMPFPPSGEYSDFYDRLAHQRAGFERVVGRAGVGTFIGCMSAARSQPARDLATDFYRRLLRGETVAHALFEARRSRPSTEEDTTLLFAMSGYPDTRLVHGTARPVSEAPRSKTGRSGPRRRRAPSARASSAGNRESSGKRDPQ